MATLYGDQYSDAYVEVPSSKIQSGDFNGKVQFLFFSYPIPAVVPTNADIIKLAKLPKGARVLDAVLVLPDLGDTTALELGWAASAELDSAGVAVEAADDNGFMATVDGDVAADTFSMLIIASGASANLPGLLKKFSAEVDIQILVTDAWTSTTTTDSIKGYIQYVIG
jgi:hypothetical protein